MGKRSKYPSYSGGSVYLNGKKVATITKKGDSIKSSYKMPKAEKQMYNRIQKK